VFVIPLGICRTRSVAKRKYVEKIENLGINSAQHSIEAELWLRSLSNRKRDAVEQATIENRRLCPGQVAVPVPWGVVAQGYELPSR